MIEEAYNTPNTLLMHPKGPDEYGNERYVGVGTYGSLGVGGVNPGRPRAGG